MGDGGEGLGNTARLIKRGGREKQGGRGRGNTFLSNSPSSKFQGQKLFFFIMKQTFSHPVCLPLYQCYFQIIMSLHFFPIFITCNVCL